MELSEGVETYIRRQYQRAADVTYATTLHDVMMLLLLVPFVLLGLTASNCDGARILAVVPFNMRSHFIVMEPLFLTLAKRGHEITVISAYPQQSPVPNYTDIDVSHVRPVVVNNFSFSFVRQNMRGISVMNVFSEFGNDVCEKVFKVKAIQDLINTTVKYDLVITEIFVEDCFTAFAHKFNAPLISFVTSMLFPYASTRVGNPDNPSYVAAYYTGVSDKMSFYHRVVNTFNYAYSTVRYHYSSLVPNHKIATKYFGNSLPPLEKIIKNTSIIFVNSHHSVTQSRPLVPSIVEVGGIHMKKHEPLPKEFHDFMESSPMGVVLVSFGSLIRASSLPGSTLQIMLEVFSQLPQRFIFKCDPEDIKNSPPNVLVYRWLPQRDLLVHPNMKAIIIHGGCASTMEAAFSGVPVLGVPMFADQYTNINFLVRNGMGRLFEIDTITKQGFHEALHDLINNPRYKEAATRVSKRFQDRPMTPLETAVYWTEYVIRHRGALHLRTVGADLPAYQFYLVDVMVLFTVTLSLVMVALYFTVNTVTRVSIRYLMKPSTTRKKKD